MLDFIRKEADQRSKTLSPDENRDFIDAYLKKINESNGTNESFNLRTLMGNALNLFGAGTNTVRASIEWNLLYCARDPEGVQRKLQQEVDNIVGRERAPEWEDRHRMPYTMAFIWEMLRWRTPTPLGLIRTAERDTTMGGFHVPAGTVVLSNFWAVHHDPEVWEHPFDFDPTRFLNADHTVLLPKPAAFIPFSTGRRMCPGETLAIMEIFIYLTTLMQKFTVLPKEGETISMDIHEGITNIPLYSQELRFLPR
ncbi:cytochrome P450, putative [Ixodes scapularis]|uniref:Cytochrome P450, putative n=1 Tax=Ixodes scapularis TaxID=6945 RepID=B7P9X7_IXOSC|nr:cytochrome P450, putative [Ixodes scapularis]|eukprot:XP_002405843.1 cytochrome P450, putative [Ixodes scapularis]